MTERLGKVRVGGPGAHVTRAGQGQSAGVERVGQEGGAQVSVLVRWVSRTRRGQQWAPRSQSYM